MPIIIRISPEEARQKTLSGEALLVCAYNSSGDKFEKYHLEGAISLQEFKTMVDGLQKDQEIIFYCN